MNHKKSIISMAVFKKDISRYAPLWGIYALMLLVFAYSTMFRSQQADFITNICQAMNKMSLINLCYGGICAMALFSDLFRPRLCYALHALPICREKWFATHLLSGFLFSFVPNMYFAVTCGVFLQQQFYLALIWLAVTSLQFVFFFCLGVFSAVCAGNPLGMSAIYGVLNFAPVLLAQLTHRLYVPRVYGVTVDTHWLSWVLPVLGFSDFTFVAGAYDTQGSWVWGGFVWSSWVFLSCTLAIGIILAALANLIYRKRPLEHAGSFLSLKKLWPACAVMIALAVGIFLDLLTTQLHHSRSFAFLYLGVFLGYFAGIMLMKRRLHVFNWKNLLGCTALMCAVALSVFLVKIDALGILRYVPDEKAVEYVVVEETQNESKYRQSAFVLDRYDTQYDVLQDHIIRDAEQISQVCSMHRGAVEELGRKTDAYNVQLTYVLKNGQTVKRTCRVEPDSQGGAWLRQYYSSWEYLFQWEDIKTYKSWLIYANAQDLRDSGQWLTKGIALGPSDHNTRPPGHNYAYATDTGLMYDLMDAIKADCDAGHLRQKYRQEEQPVYRLSLVWQTVHDNLHPYKLSSSTTLSLNLYSDCENTIAYIEQLRQTLEAKGSIFPTPSS